MSDIDETTSPSGAFPDPFLEPEATLTDSDQGLADDETAAGEDGDSAQERAARRAAPARAIQAAQRKAIAKTVQVMGAPKKTRAATAALLGVANPEDIAGITMSCLTAGKAALRPVRDVLEVAAASDAFAAMSAAISLVDNPERFKAAWDALDTVAHLGRQPGNPSKAGMALAEAASKLTDAQRDELRLPEQLIG